MFNGSIQWVCQECGQLNYGINAHGPTICGKCGHQLFDPKYISDYLLEEDYEILKKLLF